MALSHSASWHLSLRQSHPLRAGVVCPHTAPLPIAAAPNAIADDRAVDKREDNSNHAAPRCSATAIRPKQVVDVLTDRLLDQEPTLLEPRVQPRRKAEADTGSPCRSKRLGTGICGKCVSAMGRGPPL